MTRLLNRLAPFALVLVAALGGAACAAPTDASGSFDVAGASAVRVQVNRGAVDQAVLAQEAAHLDAIASDLQSVIAQVDATARSLEGSCRGPACDALGAAHARYMDAATRQMRQLAEIRAAAEEGSRAYPGADEDPASSLAGQMGFLGAMPYDFGGIESAISELQGAAGQTAALLDEARGCITRLAPIWGGSGSAAYAQVQVQWEGGASELTSSLQRVVRAASAVADAMKSTDQGVAGMFQ